MYVISIHECVYNYANLRNVFVFGSALRILGETSNPLYQVQIPN